MPRFGKADHTGRSSGKRTGRIGALFRPPDGEPWVWNTRELLCSVAWRAMGINTRRLIDFLFIEHMNHAGTENGQLIATYDQLTAFGLTRESISDAKDEAIALGLVRIEGERQMRVSSRHRLTMYPSLGAVKPTNEWRHVTEADVAAFREERDNRRKAALLRPAADG